MSVTDDIGKGMAASPLPGADASIPLHEIGFGEVIPRAEQLDGANVRRGASMGVRACPGILIAHSGRLSNATNRRNVIKVVEVMISVNCNKSDRGKKTGIAEKQRASGRRRLYAGLEKLRQKQYDQDQPGPTIVKGQEKM